MFKSKVTTMHFTNTKIRSDLIDAGCSDEALINQIEKEWLEFDVTKPESKLTDLERFIREGPGDMHRILKRFSELYESKVAHAVTLSYSFKAKDQINLQRQLSLGIKHGIWQYLPAHRNPCNHSKLNGKPFRLRKGMAFEGDLIYPGLSQGCKCSHRSMVPAFEDVPQSHLQRFIFRIRLFFC